MGISKKYIREAFRDSEIQLTREALLSIEKLLKDGVDEIVNECKLREFKRVTNRRLDRVLLYEDCIKKS